MFYLVKNSPSDLQVWLRISHGRSPRRSASRFVSRAPGYHVMNNDRVTVLSSGRLICPVAWTDDVFKSGRRAFCVAVLPVGRSRPNLAEERRPGRSAAARSDGAGGCGAESNPARDGRLLMIIRTQLGRIATSISSDGGDHWSSPGELRYRARIARHNPPHSRDRRFALRLEQHLTGKARPRRQDERRSRGHFVRLGPNLAASAESGRSPRRRLRLYERHLHRDRVLLTYYVSDENRPSLPASARCQ